MTTKELINLLDILMKKGYSIEDARKIINQIAKGAD